MLLGNRFTALRSPSIKPIVISKRGSGKERRLLKAFNAFRELAKSSMALVEELNMIKAENLINF
jgi:hypothetical protein